MCGTKFLNIKILSILENAIPENSGIGKNWTFFISYIILGHSMSSSPISIARNKSDTRKKKSSLNINVWKTRQENGNVIAAVALF